MNVTISNLGLVARSRSCWVCKNVSAIEDVSVRMFDDEGNDLPPKDAIRYLASIGHAAPPTTWASRVLKHRKHVRRSLANPPVFSPLGVEIRKLAPIAPQGGSPSWVRAPDRAIDLGMMALEELSGRLPDMADSDAISVARLGISAAGKVGDWHAKGRQLDQMDRVFDFIADGGMKDEG